MKSLKSYILLFIPFIFWLIGYLLFYLFRTVSSPDFVGFSIDLHLLFIIPAVIYGAFLIWLTIVIVRSDAEDNVSENDIKDINNKTSKLTREETVAKWRERYWKDSEEKKK